MRYIRFLKPPKVKGNTISCLITITSDLGESFLPEQVRLAATVRSAVPNGNTYITKILKWEPELRSLPVEFDIKQSDIEWPSRVHIMLQNTPSSDRFERRHSSPVELPSIVSAWSDVLDPPLGIIQASRTVERCFTPPNERVLSVWEETGESIARHLWDAGITLSACLKQLVKADGMPLVKKLVAAATNEPLNVIELGAGCGIVGISFAQLLPNSKVILTDMPEAEEIAQRNIEIANPAMNSTIIFQPLNWDDSLPSPMDRMRFDLILVADCTYNPDSSPALVNTFSALAKRSPEAVILVAMKIRHDGELIFFDLMEKAGFIKDSEMDIPLPEMSALQEHVNIYVFSRDTRSIARS